MHEIIKKQVIAISSVLIDKLGVSESVSLGMSEFFLLMMLILVSYLSYNLVVRLMRSAIIPLLQRTKNQFDDLLVEHQFFRNIAYLVPALIFYYFLEDVLGRAPVLTGAFVSGVEVVFILIALLVLNSVLDTVNDFYDRYDFAKDHPIKSVIQIIKIVFYAVGLITIVAILLNKDLGALVVSLGAVSAVIMLIFKDPILGFVGGLQLIFNKMLSIDDWITMPKFGADGNVKEINLTTVKVQNWDKTIVTIPTYSLISESFQNWRGMQESGGRRIKRSVMIDVHSIRFCTPEMIERFKQIELLHSYVSNTQNVINAHNEKLQANLEVLVNGRRQTNIGVFRAYVESYLANRNDINTHMTFMVRQLPPGEKGLPLEIYVFTKTTNWVDFEAIQSDIFDHIMAVVPEFDLKLFQYPTTWMNQ